MFSKRKPIKNILIILLTGLLVFIGYTIIFTEPRIHPVTVGSTAPAVDYAALSEAAAQDLQKYIRIATVRG